jgi:threonyl-tRNA synthetase
MAKSLSISRVILPISAVARIFRIPDFIKAAKLTSVAGAYWKGDEKNKQLTRVYGVTFPKQKELDEYLLMLEEAKKRDHRRLGKELSIFTMDDDVGQDLPLVDAEMEPYY